MNPKLYVADVCEQICYLLAYHVTTLLFLFRCSGHHHIILLHNTSIDRAALAARQVYRVTYKLVLTFKTIITG